MRPRREYPIETKPFFLTSEFVGSVLAIAGIAITAASSDAFGAWRAWILITAIVVGYMLSRGIAKSGTRSHSSDPQENLDLNWVAATPGTSRRGTGSRASHRAAASQFQCEHPRPTDCSRSISPTTLRRPRPAGFGAP